MILEIFKAAVHSVGTATTMTAAGVYLHRRGMITSETKTGMARYTQQIAIPALFFSKIVDCPQDFSEQKCPNILDHLGDAWVLLIWPFYVLAVGLFVGYLVLRLVRPPAWQTNCVLAATAFANAMGMPITLLDVIGHNFQPPGHVNHTLDPSMFQSIYVILNPVLQWGLGGWLLTQEEEPEIAKPNKPSQNDGNGNNKNTNAQPYYYFPPLRRANYSIPSLEDLGYNSVRGQSAAAVPASPPTMRRNLYSIPSFEDYGFADERTGLVIDTSRHGRGPSADETVDSMDDFSSGEEEEGATVGYSTDATTPPDSPTRPQENQALNVLKKIAKKALQPPALGAIGGFIVASYSPLRGLFVDLQNRADNAPLEWIFDGILTLAKSAIPVNMVVVGVNLSIASQRSKSTNRDANVDSKTIAAVVAGKLLIMPLIGVLTVWILKTFVWTIPEEIQFQFYLVLAINFITPTANVVMVIAELGSGADSKNVMASLIGWQYVVAPVLLSLTVMVVVWTAAM